MALDLVKVKIEPSSEPLNLSNSRHLQDDVEEPEVSSSSDALQETEVVALKSEPTEDNEIPINNNGSKIEIPSANCLLEECAVSSSGVVEDILIGPVSPIPLSLHKDNEESNQPPSVSGSSVQPGSTA